MKPTKPTAKKIRKAIVEIMGRATTAHDCYHMRQKLGRQYGIHMIAPEVQRHMRGLEASGELRSIKVPDPEGYTIQFVRNRSDEDGEVSE